MFLTPITPVIAADDASQFTEIRRLAQLVDRIGRNADTSDAAGACGGIVVHDWVAENIRAIALGDSIQAISVLDKSQHKAPAVSFLPPKTK